MQNFYLIVTFDQIFCLIEYTTGCDIIYVSFSTVLANLSRNILNDHRDAISSRERRCRSACCREPISRPRSRGASPRRPSCAPRARLSPRPHGDRHRARSFDPARARARRSRRCAALPRSSRAPRGGAPTTQTVRIRRAPRWQYGGAWARAPIKRSNTPNRTPGRFPAVREAHRWWSRASSRLSRRLQPALHRTAGETRA